MQWYLAYWFWTNSGILYDSTHPAWGFNPEKAHHAAMYVMALEIIKAE
jgi:hypothetical protein